MPLSGLSPTGKGIAPGRRWLLIITLWLTLAPAAAEEFRAGELIDCGTGSGATRHQLPATAIDTASLPYIYLSADDAARDTLPLYRLAPDTYFLYGNIATINDDNRGFNGNAGFIITEEGVVLIDALGTPRLGRRLLATIRTLTDLPIRYLIITHHHPDHAYGAVAFVELPGWK